MPDQSSVSLLIWFTLDLGKIVEPVCQWWHVRHILFPNRHICVRSVYSSSHSQLLLQAKGLSAGSQFPAKSQPLGVSIDFWSHTGYKSGVLSENPVFDPFIHYDILPTWTHVTLHTMSPNFLKAFCQEARLASFNALWAPGCELEQLSNQHGDKHCASEYFKGAVGKIGIEWTYILRIWK